MSQGATWPSLSQYRSLYVPEIQRTSRAADAANRAIQANDRQESSPETIRLMETDNGAYNLRIEQIQRRRAELTRQREQADATAGAACGRYQARYQNLNGLDGRTAAQNATLEGIRQDLVHYCGGARTH